MLGDFLSQVLARTYAKAKGGIRIKDGDKSAIGAVVGVGKRKAAYSKSLATPTPLPAAKVPDFVVKRPSETVEACAHRLKLIALQYGTPYVYSTLNQWLESGQLTSPEVKGRLLRMGCKDADKLRHGLATTDLFNRALELLANGHGPDGESHVRLCFKLAAEMRKRAVEVNGFTVSCLLKAVTRQMPSDHAELVDKALKYWGERDVRSDPYVFNSVCAYYGRTDVDKLLSLYPPASSSSKGLALDKNDIVTKTIVLESLARSNRPELCLSYYDARIGCAKYQRALLMCLSAVWHGSASEQVKQSVFPDPAKRILHATMVHDFAPETTYKALLSLQMLLLMKMGEFAECQRLYEQRVRSFWTEKTLDHDIIARYLRALNRQGHQEQAWAAFQELKSKFAYRPNEIVLMSLLECFRPTIAGGSDGAAHAGQSAVEPRAMLQQLDALMNGYVYSGRVPVAEALLSAYYQSLMHLRSVGKKSAVDYAGLIERLSRLARWAQQATPAAWQLCMKKHPKLAEVF